MIANHSLEHFDNLDAALREIARVVKPAGSVYIAVPDASTFSDKLYRWLASGGGHVNAFTSREELVALVEAHTGMHCAAGRLLISSLAMLNRKNRVDRAPRKLWVLAGGREGVLVFWNGFARWMDRLVPDASQRLRLGVVFWRARRGSGFAAMVECVRTLWGGMRFGLAGTAPLPAAAVADSRLRLPLLRVLEHLHAR